MRERILNYCWECNQHIREIFNRMLKVIQDCFGFVTLSTNQTTYLLTFSCPLGRWLLFSLWVLFGSLWFSHFSWVAVVITTDLTLPLTVVIFFWWYVDLQCKRRLYQPIIVLYRNCGLVFCGTCSEKRLPLPDEQLYDPVRVCYACFEKLVTLQQRENGQRRHPEVAGS